MASLGSWTSAGSPAKVPVSLLEGGGDADRGAPGWRQRSLELAMAVQAIPLMSKRVLSARQRRGKVFTVQAESPSGSWKLVAERPSDAELLAAKPRPDSFRDVLEHVVTAGIYFGVFPAPTDALLCFRWRSPKTLFALLVASLLLFRIVVYFYCIYVGYVTALETVVSTRIGFHVLATLEVVTFVRIASRWRAFVLFFLRAEHSNDQAGAGVGVGGPSPWPLRVKLVTLAAGALVMTTLEILLELFTYPLSRALEEFDSFGHVLEDFYNRLFNHVARAIDYNPAMLVVALFTVAATNFVLNFSDLFLISVSVVIVRRFHDLRARISKDVKRVGSFSYWKVARENFDDLSQLTRHVDQEINFLTLLSCLNNFFSICIQLQHTVRPSSATPGLVRKLYFCYSFAFVLLRSGAVVYAASSIPEESKALKRVLYSVPSTHFSEEIARFLGQVTTDDITLTGLGMFTITRSFILTMLGTIATYEILLVQTYKSDTPS